MRTGLGIVEAMGTLNRRLSSRQGVRLAVRVGIHTGLVVVGEMGEVGDRSSWRWERRPILRPDSRDWRPRIPS